MSVGGTELTKLLVWASVFAVYSWPTASHWLLAVFLLVPFASILLTLWRLGDVPTTGFRMAASTFGPLWLGAGLGSVVLLRTAPDGASLVLLCLALAWASDTGGYIAGRLLGKRKLYEAVSPKKTIEGAVGGTIAAIAASVIISIYLLDRMPIEHAVALGLVGSLGGVAGDLGESLLKRSTGVKDSGGIVPGHGGLLDRIDAVVVTAPITALYVVWAGWLPVAAP